MLRQSTKFLSLRKNLTSLKCFPDYPLRPSQVRFNSSEQVLVPVSQKWFVQVLQLAIGAGVGFYVANLVNKQRSAPSVTTSLTKVLKPKFGTAEDFEKAVEMLRSVLPAERITVDKAELYRHGHSEWSYHDVAVPSVVVYPADTDEVVMIVKIANDHSIPVVPFSGGTSLEGQFSAPSGGICVDFSRHMDKIVAFHDDDMDVVVQAGVQWEDLNRFLKPHGLFFPLDPGPGACIGGMVGTACSGTNAVRYGTMREWVINLTVVLPDGTIVKTKQRSRKSSAGYDLTKLFIGAEGTLGLVTEATLKLAVIPEKTSVAVCDFPTIRDAASAVSSIVRSGVQVGAVELLDNVMMRAINLANPKFKYAEKPTLFIKFSGSKAQIDAEIKTVSRLVAEHSGGTFRFATTPRERDELWEGRKAALWSSLLLKPGASAWTTDVVVPVSSLPHLIAETSDDLASSPLPATMVGHAGDGNFHVILLPDKNDPVEMAEARRLNARLVERAIDMDGSCTGEHGVGVGKIKYLVKELGPETIRLMWRIKNAIDPKGIMNPGKVLPDIVEVEESVIETVESTKSNKGKR